MDSHKNQRLRFTFSNSGEVLAHVRHPELIAELSPSPEKSLPPIYSSKIVPRPVSGFNLITDLEPPPWLHPLKTELGMPADAPLRHLTVRGSIFGIRYQEYTFRFVGIVIEQAALTKCSWPFWRLSNMDGDIIELVQVWYQRVSNWASPVFCDIRWHPFNGETVQLVNAENTRMRDVTIVWRGRLLLQRLSMVGRPENTVTLTQAEFAERAPQVCAKILDAFGEMPTDAQLAAALNISRTTLYRYMNRYDLPLKRIRDMAVGLLIEPAPF